MATHVVTTDRARLTAEQQRSFDEQVERLGPGVPWMACLAGDGKVYVQDLRGIPQGMIALWKRNPSMIIPDSAGYEPRTRILDIEDFG